MNLDGAKLTLENIEEVIDNSSNVGYDELLKFIISTMKELKKEVEKQQRLNRLLTKKISPRTGQRTIK